MSNHDDVTRALFSIEGDGWAFQSSGDVEAPTGWFAYLYNDPGTDVLPGDRESLLDAFGSMLDEEGVTVDDIMGGWVLLCDNYGNRDAVQYSTERDARLAFEALERDYCAWADAVDPDCLEYPGPGEDCAPFLDDDDEHGPECTECSHDCPWAHTSPAPMGAPFCSVCDDHMERADETDAAA